MLSPENRLHKSSDFNRVVRTGQKVSYGRVVVYVAPQVDEQGAFLPRPPHGAGAPARIGLIVSKAVGNSVVRHQVSRRLRHSCRSILTQIPSQTDVVIRALPGSNLVAQDTLEEWLVECVRKYEKAPGHRRQRHHYQRKPASPPSSLTPAHTSEKEGAIS